MALMKSNCTNKNIWTRSSERKWISWSWRFKFKFSRDSNRDRSPEYVNLSETNLLTAQYFMYTSTTVLLRFLTWKFDQFSIHQNKRMSNSPTSQVPNVFVSSKRKLVFKTLSSCVWVCAERGFWREMRCKLIFWRRKCYGG